MKRRIVERLLGVHDFVVGALGAYMVFALMFWLTRGTVSWGAFGEVVFGDLLEALFVQEEAHLSMGPLKQWLEQ